MDDMSCLWAFVSDTDGGGIVALPIGDGGYMPLVCHDIKTLNMIKNAVKKSDFLKNKNVKLLKYTNPEEVEW